MGEIKKGIILSYALIILTNITGLFLTPYIIKNLGDSQYGLYSLLGALIAYLSIFDLGLNNTIVRYVSKYRAEKNKVVEENFLATIMYIYIILSFIIILTGIFIYIEFDNIFKSSLSLEETKEGKIIFIILIFNLAITLPGSAFAAISNAYEHFIFPRFVQLIKYISRTILIFSLLRVFPYASTIVWIDTILSILTISTSLYFVCSKLKVKFKIHSYDLNMIKEIFSYSLWIFIYSITTQFQWSGGQLIIGLKLDTQTVAIYSIGITLGTYYGTFSSVFSNIFIPKATKMVVYKSSKEDCTNTFIKIGRFSFFPLLPIFTGFLLFGQEFINLWIGKGYKTSWEIALIIMIAYTIPLIQTFANSLLEANKLYKFKALLYLFIFAFSIGFALFIAKKGGAIAVVLSIATGWLICQIIMNKYYIKKLNLDIKTFFFNTFKSFCLPFFLLIISGVTLNSIIKDLNWFYFILKIIIYMSIYGSILYFIILNKYEKGLISNFLKYIFYDKIRMYKSSR